VPARLKQRDQVPAVKFGAQLAEFVPPTLALIGGYPLRGVSTLPSLVR
jgi:hypothetical protein